MVVGRNNHSVGEVTSGRAVPSRSPIRRVIKVPMIIHTRNCWKIQERSAPALDLHPSPRFHCTHHNQTCFVFLVGPVGSHDGNRHGNGAHDVQGDEAGEAAFQLQAEQSSGELRKHFFCVVPVKQAGAYLFSSMVGDQDVGQQREAEDEPAHHLQRKTHPSHTSLRPRP